MALGVIDIILLLCFVPALIQGIRKGLVDQLIGIAILVVGAFLAWKFSSAVTEILAPSFESVDPALLNILSFALIFVVVFIILRLLGGLVNKLIKITTLGWLNRLAGFFFAIFKAAIIIGLVITLFDSLNGHLPLIKQETLDSSVVYNAIKGFTSKIFPFVEDFIQQHNVK